MHSAGIRFQHAKESTRARGKLDIVTGMVSQNSDQYDALPKLSEPAGDWFILELPDPRGWCSCLGYRTLRLVDANIFRTDCYGQLAATGARASLSGITFPKQILSFGQPSTDAAPVTRGMTKELQSFESGCSGAPSHSGGPPRHRKAEYFRCGCWQQWQERTTTGPDWRRAHARFELKTNVCSVQSNLDHVSSAVTWPVPPGPRTRPRSPT